LVRAWANRKSPETAERACAAAQTESGGIPQQLASDEIPGLLRVWRSEFGMPKMRPFNGAVDAAGLRFAPAQRTKAKDLLIFRRQDDPVPLADAN
jgi:hypothetical protein